MPDALDRPPRRLELSPSDTNSVGWTTNDFFTAVRQTPADFARIHRAKMDERMINELTDLVGAITQEEDWLQLPRGLADGYMFFLSNAVARRRHMPKFTDSDTMFIAMEYFATDGAFDEDIYPEEDDDFDAALIIRGIVPQGIEQAGMADVLKFRDRNRDGREAFRSSVTNLARQLAVIDSDEYLLDLAEQFKTRMEESEKITMRHLVEHFSAPEPLLLYVGIPLAAKAFEAATHVKDSVLSLGSFGIAGIAAIADIVKTKRKEWAPSDATYYCKLKQTFNERSPIPKRMHLPGVLMDEFMND